MYKQTRTHTHSHTHVCHKHMQTCIYTNAHVLTYIYTQRGTHIHKCIDT